MARAPTLRLTPALLEPVLPLASGGMGRVALVVLRAGGGAKEERTAISEDPHGKNEPPFPRTRTVGGGAGEPLRAA